MRLIDATEETLIDNDTVYIYTGNYDDNHTAVTITVTKITSDTCQVLVTY